MGGFADIGINLPLMVAFIINFVILFALLGIFLYKPVMKMIDDRSNRIKEGMERAEATKEEYERTKVEVQEQISQAREEGQTIVGQASQIGDRLKEEARQEARKEAQDIIGRTRVELEEERDKVIDNLRREFVDISIKAAEKVINETLDEKIHRRLIEETLDESTAFKKN